MRRRSFLQAGAAATALTALPRISFAQQKPYDPKPGDWRRFEITTRVEILKPEGASRAWIPLPSVESDYQKVLGNSWAGNASVRKSSDPKYGAGMAVAEWRAGEKTPVVEVTSAFATRNRAVDFSRHDPSIKIDAATAKFTTAPTELIPTDGIVRDTARDITKGMKTDVDKARALYEWIVDNTFRDPKVKGCGWGDIKTMLETRNFGGKCGDLNAMFVGMARSVGIPARDVYGVRVAASELGYKSLGLGSPNASRGQHCRAEFFAQGIGWVPVDPADVRKVVLEEPPGNIALTDPKVMAARKRLFGGWEMNWLAYNTAHDVKLPNSTTPKIPYLMYTNGETGGKALDQLDPDTFKYTITATEIKA